MTTADDRQAIIDGYRTAFGEDPALPVAQLLHAVAIIETGFGRAWRSVAGKASNNLGAIQYRTPRQLGLSPPYPQVSPDGEGFLYTDSSPNGDGTSTPYSVYFRRYPTLADGAADLARVVYRVNGRSTVLDAAKRGDSYGFSAAMYHTRYYEGFGATPQKRIANHHKAITRALNQMARELNEPLPGGGSPPPPTLKRGSQGEAVKDWQRVLGVVADGMFGPETERATKVWQLDHGLDPDGIVGPDTWGAVDQDDPVEADTEPPHEPTLSDIWLALGQLATKEDVASLRAAVGHLTDRFNEMTEPERVEKIAQKAAELVVKQLGNGAG